MFYDSLSVQFKTKKFLEFPNTNKYLFCYSRVERFVFWVDLSACLWGTSQQIIKDKGVSFKKGALQRAPFLSQQLFG